MVAMTILGVLVVLGVLGGIASRIEKILHQQDALMDEIKKLRGAADEGSQA
jgi:hypothetical protein